MANLKRNRQLIESELRAQAVARDLGMGVRDGRISRRLTQRELGERVRLRQSRISEIERGEGGTLPLESWIALSDAVGRPLRVTLARDTAGETIDAGHLAMQALVVRLMRNAGYATRVELRTPSGGSVDVAAIDRRRHCLLLCECWNALDDLGAASRSSDGRRAELEEAAVAHGGGRTLSIHTRWVVRAARHNRALVARYPSLFESRFPASSRTWLRAIARGEELPTTAGMLRCDVAARHVHEWRRAAR